MNKYLLISPGYTPEDQEWHAVTDCLPAPTDAGSYVGCSPSVLLWTDDRPRTGYLRVDQDEAVSTCWLLDGRDAYTAHRVTHWRWLPDPPQAIGE